MKRLSLIVIAGLSLFAVGALPAAPYYGQIPYAAPAQPAVQADPSLVLREGMGKLLKFMRQQESPTPQAIARFLEHEIAPYFDFDYMAGWAAGPMGRYMNGRQRAELAQSIKQMLLGTLAERLANYENQDVRFFPSRRAGENEVQVRVGILQAGGYPANIDFRFYRGNDGWKVFDVSANGNSALVYYRQYFNRRMAMQRTPAVYR
jgi:phospholipid transport system substrate-binding protein